MAPTITGANAEMTAPSIAIVSVGDHRMSAVPMNKRGSPLAT